MTSTAGHAQLPGGPGIARAGISTTTPFGAPRPHDQPVIDSPATGPPGVGAAGARPRSNGPSSAGDQAPATVSPDWNPAFTRFSCRPHRSKPLHRPLRPQRRQVTPDP